MLLTRATTTSRLLAAVTSCLLLLGVGSVVQAGRAVAESTTVDGVTSAPPSITMVSARTLTRDGDTVSSRTHTAISASFSLGVAQRTHFSEVRLALRSDSVQGDSYDAGRRYEVTVDRDESFVAEPVVPDGTWRAAALWLKAGRWNTGPWTTFSLRDGSVVLDPTEPSEPASPAPTAPEPAPSPVAAPRPAPAPATSVLRRGDFDTSSFAQWDHGGPSVSPNPGGSVTVDAAQVYAGAGSARASIPSGGGNKFARTLWGDSSGSSGSLDRGEGSASWYGVAVYLPVGFHASMQSYFVPMRWDNFGVTHVSRTGLSMWQDGSIRLFRERDGVESQTNLLGSTTFRLSEGEWHWLEVHQKLSATDGQALNELYVDGALVGSSTARNFYGEPLSALRYGIVAIDGARQTQPLSIWYDRATLSSGPVGPRG